MLHAVSGKVVQRVGTRTDQAHFTPQHIPKLGEFIEAVPPKPAAQARDPRIAGDLKEGTRPLVESPKTALQCVCISHHGAKLVTSEWSALAPHAKRRIHRWTWRIPPDPARNQHKDRPQQQKTRRRPDHVHGALRQQPDRGPRPAHTPKSR